MQEVTLSENCWIYLGPLKPLDMVEFRVVLYDVEGYINIRSEEMTEPDVENLYPVEFKRASPSAATILHRCRRPNSFTPDQIDGNTLRHLMGKKATIPLDVIFAYRALFPESIGQIKVDYERDLIDVLREVTSRIIPCLAKLGDLLEAVSFCPDVPDAPSWMLNIANSGHIWNATHYFGMWCATRNFGVPSPSTHRVSRDMDSLHVTGLIVDSVAVISDEFPLYVLENQATWHEKVRDMLVQWRIGTQNTLIASFEESVIEILFAQTNAIEEMADIVLSKLEKVCLHLLLCTMGFSANKESYRTSSTTKMTRRYLAILSTGLKLWRILPIEISKLQKGTIRRRHELLRCMSG